MVELAYLGSTDQLERLLQLKANFSEDVDFTQAGDILLYQGFVHYALDMYLFQINRGVQGEYPCGEYYCKAGFCCYKLKDFSGAITCFGQALTYGYRNHDIFEFLEWVYQQCDNEVIKEKCHILKTDNSYIRK
ncbi:hypothetical protein P22_2346 [Propionispora sp. 2/2-37]|uniref:hypothetical protein n=1 Tax=Propionispora sp. 2/2-37 TaxID=1677858 RepID=UPI0006BB9296|nr:hypothetical protein [Propionispora sp. 2/2-37]CUH96256.1 hypothetical protein P22_2346 [Propionispora sp. 2/2-37]